MATGGLRESDLAMFAKLRIPEALVERSKIRRVSDAEACRILSRKPEVLSSMAGLEFPYISPGTGFPQTSRIRRDQPDADGARKYMASGYDRSHLYFVPDTTLHPQINIILVEAEKSALAVTAWAERKGLHHDYAAVAMGGCWGWRGKIGKKPLPDGGTEREFGTVADLDKLRGHNVYIALDGNVAGNWSVQEAELRLISELRARECSVFIIRIPARSDVNGPDDLIAINESEWEAVLKSAKTADSLEAFNDEFAFVRDNCAIVALRSMGIFGVEQFLRLTANRFRSIEYTDKDGTVRRKRRKIASEWLEWPGRREVESLTYEPGKPRFVNGSLNRWQGWGCDPEPGDIDMWIHLLDYMFGKHTPERKWFEQWCAYPLQYPGFKLKQAVVLWSVQTGVGKTSVALTLNRIHGANGTIISEHELKGAFNDWAEGKTFIGGEEVTGSDSRQEADRLKLMITQKEIYINRKFVPEYKLRDCINYLFTSNHPNCFLLEDADRRFFVHEVTAEQVSDTVWNEYYDWLDNQNGAAHLFHYLLHLDTSDFKPHAPAPMTAAKREMIEFSRTDVARWISETKENPDKLVSEAGWVWTAEQLLNKYDPDKREKLKVRGMALELKKHLPKKRTEKKNYFALGMDWAKKDSGQWDAEYARGHPGSQ